MSDFQDISLRIEGGVAHVTIERPDSLNAYRPGTVREMIAAIREADASSAGVVVLTGAGGRAFSSGGDINFENTESFRAGADSMDELVKQLYRAFRQCRKPIIAKVRGYAIGGGNHLAYFCDFTVAADTAIFGQNGPRIASPAEGWIVSQLWTIVGMKRAKEMWMLCRRYSAQQAYEIGLVNEVVPESELDATVDRWCAELLEKSPTVIALVKRSFDDSVQPMRDELDRFKIVDLVAPGFFASGEQDEGAKAFFEKRPADFSPWR
jgi:dihydroxynaphthoic acid synthetase